MFNCRFCGETDHIEKDPNGRGFWCEDCDGFTYNVNEQEQHKFTLLLEDSAIPWEQPAVRSCFKKQLSPLRYPGGKSKVIDFLYTQLQSKKTDLLVSPYTGGGSFELAMLEAGVVNSLHLNDLDIGIYSFWWTVLHAPDEIIDRLSRLTPNRSDFYRAQAIIKSDYTGVTIYEAAWAAFLVNRLAYSGIAMANPLGGKKGTTASLLSRWNPKQLIKRIQTITSMADRIKITCKDACAIIEEAYWHDKATIFIDPPYVMKGKALYNCYYTEDDHRKLAFLLDSLHQGMPGADLVVTYDHNDWLQDLYSYPDITPIGRFYSI